MRNIGVIGLGIIGRVWARHYHDAGILAGAWNRTPRPDAPQWKSTPEQVASAADVIHIVVADPPAVRDVLDRMAPLLAGKIVIQSSTIDPDSSEAFRTLVMKAGARYLEAPFTGSGPAAEQKQQVFYLGGPPELIEEVEPFLSLLSTTRNRIGDHKQAAMLKLALNLNIAAQMEALCEALTMARQAGIADEIFFGALSKNAAYSGLAKLKEPKLRTADFAPQFSVKHMLKDMRLASAASGGHPRPLLESVKGCLAAAAAAGYADEDFSAMVKLLS